VNVRAIPAAEAIARYSEFSSILDARSEDEWAEDHLPGALNWPSLNNDERRIVGTLYKQVSPFEAQKRGAAMVAANIARHIERGVMDKPKNWHPLAYCWRGGKRSGSLALVLGQIGFRVSIIEGGYKAFRAALVQDIPRLVAGLQLRVVCGPTGSGKTRLLQSLRKAGAQVLDLEDLANHRSSVLGAIPGVPQPSQKRFDTLVWDELRRFDPSQPVYVESESKKVGDVAVPDSLVAAMRASPCYGVDLPLEERVALLLEEYDFFVKDADAFCGRLDALVQLRGKAVVQGWKDHVRAGRFDAVVRDLLAVHYDPGYARSMRSNFARYDETKVLAAASRSTETFDRLARELGEGTP
jgi:tRNA 2-selenouridine synthase